MIRQPLPLSSVPTATPDRKVEVRRVDGALQKDAFIQFQWKVYATDLNWVPPLLMERREFLDARRNPFFRHAEVALFVARRAGEVVGRIAAVEDHNYNAHHRSKTAYFGLYESVNDVGVAAALFKAAREWARSRGLQTLIGPLNLSSNHELGLLVEGFDSAPYVMMPYNPRYYGALFERCGLRKAKDLFAWERSVQSSPPEHFARIADRIREDERIAIRNVNLRDFANEVKRLRELYNRVYAGNWGFVPMAEDEFLHIAKALRGKILPELAMVAEHDGLPVAFSITVPDSNQALKKVGGRLTRYGLPVGLAKLAWYSRRIDRVRLVGLGIEDEWRRRGVDAVLVVETIRRARALGYAGGEISWTAEDSELNRTIESCGCARTKVYRVYETGAE